MLACTKLQYFGFYLVMFAFVFGMMLRVRVACLHGLSQLIPVLISSFLLERPSNGAADLRVRTIILCALRKRVLVRH